MVWRQIFDCRHSSLKSDKPDLNPAAHVWYFQKRGLTMVTITPNRFSKRYCA
jgi:hypothetical protein